MSSEGIKNEERHIRGSATWRDDEKRDRDRRFSPPRVASQVTSRDEKVKREEKFKREHSTTNNDDEHTSSSHDNKRPKTEASSASAASPTPPPHTQPPPPAAVKKESINLGLSGKLVAHANTTTGGSILKYQPPADAALPTLSYRLYCFPTTTTTAPASPQPPLYIHSQSLYRVGREPSINDLVIDHPSVSKQHAVLQYRRPAHSSSGVRLYVLDVGSVNGTMVNGGESGGGEVCGGERAGCAGVWREWQRVRAAAW